VTQINRFGIPLESSERRRLMPWSKPDFVEISLSMEVTAYVNTDESVVSGLLSEVGERRTIASAATNDGQRTTDN
jgi:coenzyme PQQ precursor peptide PqqA